MSFYIQSVESEETYSVRNFIVVLKDRSFLLLFIATNLINLAQSMSNIAVVWIIYKTTSQPLLIAASIAAMELPAMLFGPLLSPLLDKKNPASITALATLCKSFLFGMLTVFPLQENIPSFSLFFLLLTLSSAVSPLVGAGNTIIIGDIFSGRPLVVANSLMIIAFDVAYILGSLASGIIMTVGKGTNSFLITAALFILTSVLFSQIRTNRKVTKIQNVKIKANIWQAVHYIFKQKNTLHITLLTTIWNMLMWGSLPIILPVFVKTSLHATSTTYGLLNAMSSVGIIVGSIFAVSLGNRRTSLQIVTYSVLIQGALYSGLGFSQRPFIFASVLIVTGLVSSSTMIYKTTYYQEEVSKEMQGRVLILINALGSVTYPLGNFITAGLLSMHMNSNLLFIISGLMITMSALVSLILMRKT